MVPVSTSMLSPSNSNGNVNPLGRPKTRNNINPLSLTPVRSSDLLAGWPVRVIHGMIFFISRELPISSYNVRSRVKAQDLDLKCEI